MTEEPKKQINPWLLYFISVLDNLGMVACTIALISGIGVAVTGYIAILEMAMPVWGEDILAEAYRIFEYLIYICLVSTFFAVFIPDKDELKELIKIIGEKEGNDEK